MFKNFLGGVFSHKSNLVAMDKKIDSLVEKLEQRVDQKIDSSIKNSLADITQRLKDSDVITNLANDAINQYIKQGKIDKDQLINKTATSLFSSITGLKLTTRQLRD
jgi:DNA-binding transcriptional regulator GbsR (MarR family)